MRPLYRKVLKARFADLVKTLDPPFGEFEGPPRRLRGFAYVNQARNKVHIFIIVHINSKGWQSFTVEFGWSRLGRFPEVLPANFPDLGVNPQRVRLEEYRQRVGVFLGGDKWWFLEPRRDIKLQFKPREVSQDEAEMVVASALADVEQILRANVIPYFKEFLRRR